MKKLLYILALITGVVNAQIVTIPDANLKSALLSASPTLYIAKNLSGSFFKVDANSDGEIQDTEAMQVSYLYLRNMNISNLSGIESFGNLSQLICEMNSISSLDNIMGLTSLTVLRCGTNNLTTLDVSSLVNLVQLNCEHNNMTSLNVSNLSHLINFMCSFNNLTTLDVSDLTNVAQMSIDNNHLSSIDLLNNNSLTLLNCESNELTGINVANLAGLMYFYCGGNSYQNLTVSNLTALNTLECGNDQITGLNLANLPNIKTLMVFGLNLTSLDLTPYTSLTRLDMSWISFPTVNLSTLVNLTTLNITYNPNLQTIDLSTLVNLTTMSISENPSLLVLDLSSNPNLYNITIHSDTALTYINLKNGTTQNIDGLFFDTSLTSLQFICGDESELAILHSEIDYFYQSYNVSVSTYCTFIPGGNYNTITGTMTFDADNNGCDASDDIQPNIRMNINDGTNTGATFTNTNGVYTFYTQIGNFGIAPAVENPTWFNFSPTSATIPFTNNNNNVVTQNFCITANGVHPDLEIVIAPIIPARPGFDAVYKIVYKNKGNQTMSQLYGISFSFDNNLMSYVSSSDATSSAGFGTLTWDFANLLPFESRSILVTMHVNSPVDSNPVAIGDILTLTAIVNPIAADENVSDNTFQFNQTVVGSFDPNEVTCIEGNMVSPTEIGNYLHYIINFENTGTADAENIVVRDVIDTTQFDINSLQILNSSSPITAKLTGNIAEFIFQNVNLHSGGHGNILIKVKSKNTLVQGSTVSKRANIYFDYNAPIDTNLENTTFQTLSNTNHEIDKSISVYPNPTKGNVTIKCHNNIQSVQLYDVQGRLLQTNLVNENQTIIDISGQSSGVYFLKIVSDKGIGVQKIVKQ